MKILEDEIKIGSFYISKYKLNNDLYIFCIKKKNCHWYSEIMNVFWEKANEKLRKLYLILIRWFWFFYSASYIVYQDVFKI